MSDRFGPATVVQMRDVPDPVPTVDELLVRVRASAVTQTDRHDRSGRPLVMRAVAGVTRPKTTILGCEFAGDVVGCGASATQWKVGDRVFGYVEGRPGGHAELLTVRATGSVAAIPSGTAYETAAASTEGSHYALTILRKGGVAPGTRVLVYGASGATCSAAIQLARTIGATVTAVCGPDGLQPLRALGFDDVLDYTAGEVASLPASFDVFIDAWAYCSYKEMRRYIAPGGCHLSTGPGRHAENTWLYLTTRVGRGPRALFSIPKIDQAMVAGFADHIVQGTFRPLIDRTYPLTDIVEAYQYVESGTKIGSVVVTI